MDAIAGMRAPAATCRCAHGACTPTAHHDDRPVAAEFGLNLRGGVVDADALELGDSRHPKLAVAGTGRHDHRPRKKLGFVIEAQRVVATALR